MINNGSGARPHSIGVRSPVGARRKTKEVSETCSGAFVPSGLRTAAVANERYAMRNLRTTGSCLEAFSLKGVHRICGEAQNGWIGGPKNRTTATFTQFYLRLDNVWRVEKFIKFLTTTTAT